MNLVKKTKTKMTRKQISEEERQERFENRMPSFDLLLSHGRQFKESGEDEILERVDKPKLLRLSDIAIKAIDEPDREIFLLYSQGFVQTEIGKRTNREQSFVSKSIKRTRRKLLFIIQSE